MDQGGRTRGKLEDREICAEEEAGLPKETSGWVKILERGW